MLRIGELSRRCGVSDHVLRAWENRYGLLRPVRSPGGFRLYSEDDEERVHRMRAHLASGLSASEAARVTLAEEHDADRAGEPAGRPGGVPVAPPEPLPARRREAEAANQAARLPDPRHAGELARLAETLRSALDAFDEPVAQATLDRLITDFTVEAVLRDVVLPYLHDLGVRWERGEASIAQEHFASHVVGGRLNGLARGWGEGGARSAVLACPPGEQHDLALLVFGVVLHRCGWRVRYLGVSTPLDEVVAVADRTRPDVVVLAAAASDRFTDVADGIVRLTAAAPLALGGAGATEDVCERTGARRLTADPVTEARRLADALADGR